MVDVASSQALVSVSQMPPSRPMKFANLILIVTVILGLVIAVELLLLAWR